MKKAVIIIAMLCALVITLTACNPNGNIKVNPDKEHYVVGTVQIVPHPALDAATKGFKDALTEELAKEGRTVEFIEKNAGNDPTIGKQMVGALVAEDVDLILANATPILQGAATSTLTIPILGTSVTEYGVALNIKNFGGTTGRNISGTSDLAPLNEQAKMIVDLVPTAKTVGLIYCSAEANSKYQIEQVQKFLTETHNKQCKVYAFADTSDLATQLPKAAQECDVLYVPTDNTVAANTGMLKNLSLQHQIPIIAGEEGICNGCGIATLSISYEQLGRVTGQMAAKVLLGKEDITKMEIAYDSNPVYKYNEEMCTALGITVPNNYVKIESAQ